MTDARLEFDSGRICWVALRECKPLDNAPLPCREDMRKQARAEALASLRQIRADHVRDFDKPWLGAEHGKAIVGQAIDGAISCLESEA
jgi:hypothetical protein